jgi:hypothetical protein
MTAQRVILQDNGGLTRNSRAGDNLLSSRSLTTIAADANATLSVATISGGLVQFTGFTAGRTLTTDTAANILAANPWMDIGDSFEVVVSITTAFAGTLAAGTGITLAGLQTVPASGSRTLLITKTSATAVTVTGI